MATGNFTILSYKSKQALLCNLLHVPMHLHYLMYPTELQLKKSNFSNTEAPFLDKDLSITNGIVSTKIYDKWGDFNFEIVYFPFLGGEIPRSLPMVYTFRNLFVMQEFVIMLITSKLLK